MTIRYYLIPAKFSKGDRCDKCPLGKTMFVFLSQHLLKRWQKRCRKCAEKMIADGKAKFDCQ